MLKDAVTWLLVIAGWWLVHQATLARERRKENRDAINKVIEDLRRIEQVAVGFHQAIEFNGTRARELRIDLERALRRINKPPCKRLEIPTRARARARQAVTRENMDRSSFVRQDSESHLLLELTDAFDGLINEIETARDKKFR